MLTRPKILIVDDKPENLFSIEAILGNVDVDLVRAACGSDALRETMNHDFALALLAVQMPEMDGYELAAFLRSDENTRHVPIIFLSAVLTDEFHVFKGYQSGGVDFIPKPFNPEVLLNKVKIFLELYQQKKNLQRSELLLKRSYETQQFINSILHSSLNGISLDEVLAKILSRVVSLSWPNFETRGAVFVVEKENERLAMRASIGLSPSVRKKCGQIAWGECLCGRAARDREVLFERSDDLTHNIVFDNMPLHAHYCVPIMFAGQVKGVINLYLSGDHQYDVNEEVFLKTVANTMAGIIHRKEMENEKALLEEQVRQSQKMEALGTLSGGIAHDFNNILTAIIGNASLAMDDIDGSDLEIVRDELRTIIKASNRAADLVRQILAFGRHAGGSEIMPIHIVPIVQETLKLLRSTVPSTIEIKQTINLKPDRVVAADPVKLYQVLMNLFTNSYHAVRGRQGVIELCLHDIVSDGRPINSKVLLRKGEYVKISVRDNGHGMTPDIIDKIFNPFFTTKPPNEGTGLGLTVAYTIINDLGGRITVESEPGKGTVFDIYLPLLDSQQGKEFFGFEEQVAKDLRGGSERILLVDDELDICRLGERMLGRLGYRVLAMTSSVDALETFKADPSGFDLVITDQSMPELSGVRITEEILRLRQDMPVILCTGFSETVGPEKAKEIGIRAFLMKPVDIGVLSRVIRQVLDNGAHPEQKT